MLSVKYNYDEIQRAWHVVCDYIQQVASHTDIPCVKKASLILKLIMVIWEKWKILVKTIHHSQTVAAKWTDLRYDPEHQHEHSRYKERYDHNIIVRQYISEWSLILFEHKTFAENIVDD